MEELAPNQQLPLRKYFGTLQVLIFSEMVFELSMKCTISVLSSN